MTLPPLPRLLVLVAALLLASLYAVPLWQIALGAPQYPEGLGLRIWIDTIAGIKEHDLRNINSLNHYIGMRAIEPDAIPELRFMPWVLGGLVAFGLAVAAAGRRRLLVAWLATLSAAGAVGLVDFWRWTYDYGHNLDEATAIIKVPGMTYQPPLIGRKQLLNFTASSWPDVGAWLALLAFALGVAALWLALRGRHAGARRVPSRAAAAARPAAALVLLAIVLAGCGPGHPELRYGEESCRFCRMAVADPRFGAVLTTAKGRQFVFDSVECLARFQLLMPEAPAALFVADFARPGTVLRLDEAVIAQVPSVSSPMGLSLVAVAAGADLAAAAGPEARRLAWSDVLALVRDADRAGAPGADAHAEHDG